MRAAEILRKMADIIDSKESGQSSNTEITNRPEVVDVEVSAPADASGIEGDAQVNTKSMVGPLQQKLDLMKRMAGLETNDIALGDGGESCSTCGCAPCACCGDEPDELAIMKQNAGISPIAVLADEDEPTEG
jgi:hypothetical protein